MIKWVYRLDEIGREDNDIVGKKCANLGELNRAGFRIPQGFALPLVAYDKFMKDTRAINEIEHYLRTFDAEPNDPADIIKFEEASKEIRKIVEHKDIPQDLENAISKYYKELSQMTGINNIHVAIRSAGPSSHPGQYESYLYISGQQEVIKNVVKVWSSTFNQRSLIARARLRLPLHYDPIGVCMCAMVNAKTAGVMFTLNPINGDLSKIVIEGNWGLGESVVSGSVTPDKWVVDKVTFEITEKVVVSKLLEYTIDTKTDMPLFIDTPSEKQNIPCLSEKEVLELANIGKGIERYFSIAQDIEWAIDKNFPFPENIIILQTRPAQVSNNKEVKPVFGSGKTMFNFIQDIATHGKL